MNANTSLTKSTFLFDDQKRFDAQCEHDRLRNSIQDHTEIPSTADPWKQPPIDFTLKNFHPDRKRITNVSLINDISPNEKQLQISRIYDPVVMKPFAVSYQDTTTTHLTNDDNDFALDTRIKYDKVKRMLNTEQYKNPKLHDYRQYPNIKDLGLSEFYTTYERDPYRIRFLSNHLNTLWLQEREHERVPIVQKPLPEMYRALTARAKWDSRLILPKLVFPNKYAAYTRYRNPTRTIQSAYWERVEDHFGQHQKKRLDIS
ncbi:unnamed protein product [Rotaria sordida]|uniref:Uncharacterized protein n=1 Tax=Rotaria sordida TaxID=392033 RepID=A0A813YX49_9BILA|nr:unnamed protein product [Rotaria sordida]CAF0889958.1 unnamed protein product [Rotaria sordida]CAF0949199.1 unnamed protein product [Rotaria sordida]CAF1108844.1 unnamed protein product [Rotaria sordida]CAF3613216.1 unnamed protein product [Rotaria sordida]